MRVRTSNVIVVVLIAAFAASGWLLTHQWQAHERVIVASDARASAYREALRFVQGSAVVIAEVPSEGEPLVVECSAGVRRILGWSPGELRGQPISRLIPQSMQQQHRRALSAAVRNRSLTDGATAAYVSCNALTKEGQSVAVLITLRMIEADDATLYFAAVIDRQEDVRQIQGGDQGN